MADPREYYKCLDLKPGASLADVKQAYKKKQIELHPQGANRRKMRETPEYAKLSEEEKKTKEKALDDEIAKINEAFSVLGNEKKKDEYDNEKGEFAQGFGGFGGFEGFSDIFSHFRGGGDFYQQERRNKSEPIVTKISISLADVFKGKTNKYKIKIKKACKGCKGVGRAEKVVCKACQGRGAVYVTKRFGMMITKVEKACADCNGKGEIAQGPVCKECSGNCILVDTIIMTVVIPKGIVDGHRISFPEQGNVFPDCEPGDIEFIVSVQEDPNVKRVKNDLYMTAPIDLLSALTGGTAYIDHPDGRRLGIDFAPIEDFNKMIVVNDEGFPTDTYKGKLYLQPDIKINKGLRKEALEKIIPALLTPPANVVAKVRGTWKDSPKVATESDHYDGSDAGHGSRHQGGGFGEDILRSFGFF